MSGFLLGDRHSHRLPYKTYWVYWVYSFASPLTITFYSCSCQLAYKICVLLVLITIINWKRSFSEYDSVCTSNTKIFHMNLHRPVLLTKCLHCQGSVKPLLMLSMYAICPLSLGWPPIVDDFAGHPVLPTHLSYRIVNVIGGSYTHVHTLPHTKWRKTKYTDFMAMNKQREMRFIYLLLTIYVQA
jgi:hypothetical protein